MKKIFYILFCLAIVFPFAACNKNDDAIFPEDVTFTETENKSIVASDGSEYTFVGFEYNVQWLGELDFIAHMEGEIETFVHLSSEVKTGMFYVNGERDVLVRYFPDNEFGAVYVKSGLLESEISLENCIRFVLVRDLYSSDSETALSTKGITECERFLNEIKSGQKAEEAGLYDLVRHPNGLFENCYIYGYICGIVQEDIDIVIPLMVTSFDDKAYSIRIDDAEYVLPEEWLSELTD